MSSGTLGNGWIGHPSACVPPVTRCLWDTKDPYDPGTSSTRFNQHTIQNGTFYPDGIYSENWKVPAYQGAGNMAAARGAISLWIKPNFDPPKEIRYSRAHIFFDASRGCRDSTCMLVFYCAGAGTFPGEAGVTGPHQGRFGCLWDDDFTVGDWTLLCESQDCTPQRTTLPHRWYLMTGVWDAETTRTPVLGDATSGNNVYVDRGLDAEDQSGILPLYSPYGNVHSRPDDGTPFPPLDYSAGLFCLGSRNYSG